MNVRDFVQGSVLGLFCWVMAPATAHAKCEVHYKRTACAGQEKISFKKCGGNAECTKEKKASSEAECKEKAVKSCRNKRLDITKSKVITAKWNGAAIKNSKGGDDFCVDYANTSTEFNQCKQ